MQSVILWSRAFQIDVTHFAVSYSSKALSFDTHINKVEKIYTIRHFEVATILKISQCSLLNIVLSPE